MRSVYWVTARVPSKLNKTEHDRREEKKREASRMDHKECVWVKYLLPKVCNGLKCRTVLALGLHQNTCQSNILKNKVVDQEAQTWWGGSQTSETSPFFSEASELTGKQQMWPELPKKAPFHPPSSSPSSQYPQAPIPAMMQPGSTGHHLTLSETPWGAILQGSALGR